MNGSFAPCSLVLLVALGLAHAPEAVAQRALVPRQVAAPASDITSGRLRLPDPSAGAVRCRGALLELDWGVGADGRWTAAAEVPVKRGDVGVAVQALDASGFALRFRLVGAPGRGLELAPPADARRDQALSAEFGFEKVQRWDLAVPASGILEITIDAKGDGAPARARLAVRDAQPLTASAFVDTVELTSDRTFALVAQIEDDDAQNGRTPGAASSATAYLEGPGLVGELELLDDGLSGDGVAGDGTFGAWLPMGLSGAYAATVELRGVRGGAPFLRTTRVTFDVAEPTVALTGAARGVVTDAERVRLDVGAWLVAESARAQLSAEVWGTNASGELEPMAWLSRIQTAAAAPSRAGGNARLSLDLDAGWMMRTALLPPLELRAVRVQDPDSHAVLARADRLAVALDPRWRALPALHAPAPPLTALAGMTAGVTGPTAIDRPGLALRPGLVLSHGYCSGSPPWPNGDFSGTRVAFNDLNQNRSHDQFANLLAAQAWGAGLTSYGVVGHSQGGAAALHLLTFYESGLDLAQGARRIQSVGTPYQGTPLASLGFFACGVNNDLTPGGAATWLSSIPSWARAEVSYYTTANDGGACQFLTALLLSNPEDGTTENARGQLPGAMNMGFVTGWCHTTGMSDPPQYRDASRNAIMDAAAAR